MILNNFLYRKYDAEDCSRIKKNFIKKIQSLQMDWDWFVYIWKRRQLHKWHIVSPSPWPFLTACSIFIFVIGLVCTMHFIKNGKLLLFIGVVLILMSMFFWFRDIIRESTFMGYHTIPVQQNLRFGFILFIVSEVMFFFSFFWAYFHCSLSPSIWIGSIWPAEGIVYFFISENFNTYSYYYNFFYDNKFLNNGYWTTFNNFFKPIKVVRQNFFCYKFIDLDYYNINKFNIFWKFTIDWHNNLNTVENDTTILCNFLNDSICVFKKVKFNTGSIIYGNLYDKGVLISPYSVPLLNTAILLTSGAVLTLSHALLRIEQFLFAIWALIVTVILAFYFILCQFVEYSYCSFSINDGIYGSLFFMLTGFHGFHVIVGTVFLSVCLLRFFLMHFTRTDHLGFEAAIWYWHFVDVVWILLYLVVYLWPAYYFFKTGQIVVDFSGIDRKHVFTKYFCDTSLHSLRNISFTHFLSDFFYNNNNILLGLKVKLSDFYNFFFHNNYNNVRFYNFDFSFFSDNIITSTFRSFKLDLLEDVAFKCLHYNFLVYYHKYIFFIIGPFMAIMYFFFGRLIYCINELELWEIFTSWVQLFVIDHFWYIWEHHKNYNKHVLALRSDFQELYDYYTIFFWWETDSRYRFWLYVFYFLVFVFYFNKLQLIYFGTTLE